MKPESVNPDGRYQLSASVARFLRVPVQTIKVSRRDSARTFRCYFDDGTAASIAADDLSPIPAPCSPLDAGPL